MDNLKKFAALASMVLLALLDAAAGMGVALPGGADAQGVALLNTAVLSIGALVYHFMTPTAPVDPVDPAA